MEKVEWADVQGLVLSGYQDLRFAAYIMWRFLPCPGGAAKQWLSDLTPRLMRADTVDTAISPRAVRQEPDQAVRPTSLGAKKMLRARHGKKVDMWVTNLALTASGLEALGVENQELCRFSSEFLEGMAPVRLPGQPIPRRTNVLGDLGSSSPEHWLWGGWNGNRKIDGLLLLYANSKEALDRLVDFETEHMDGAAEPVGRTSSTNAPQLILKGRIPKNQKEHFGFRDGISQPIIDGTRVAKTLDRKEARISLVQPGEFVLGYANERGARLSFATSERPGDIQARDLARNGTYLVFRQLEQDVPTFRGFVAEAAKCMHSSFSSPAEAEHWVASRLIGRTRDGEPLISPAADTTEEPEKRNDFLYHFEDRFGLACPIGAHIRRANPRDTIGPDPETALRLSKMHRIIRRGRSYGEKLPLGAEGKAKDGEPRGIFFICLNADIAGQFELIQHSWINNTHFGGLYDETDPLSHIRGDGGTMTIQGRPANLKLDRLPQFVTVRGGAYFFMPGIAALRALAR